jgi:2'-5' RNA ligase
MAPPEDRGSGAGRRHHADLDDPLLPVARDGTIYVIAPLQGAAAERVLELQREYDPRMSREWRPHVTLAGSSGMGPVPPSVSVHALREALEPVAASTPPMKLPFGPPVRFMQSDVIVLPLDPHGPLRELHERIRQSGLPYAPPRFAFTPHCTLSFYPELTRRRAAELLAFRMEEVAEISTLEAHYMGRDRRGRKLLGLDLRGEGSG